MKTKDITNEQKTNEKFMNVALKQAQKAYDKDEVPVGCVIVLDGKIIARAYNLRENLKQACAHAEILAIKKACKKIKDWRLNNCDIYVTVEPCPMCSGAIVNARIRHIYFGTTSLNGGSCVTLYNIPQDKRLSHNCEITGGILSEQCKTLMTKYFKEKRKTKPKKDKNQIN